MKMYIMACGIIFSLLFMTPSHALTIKGVPINSPVKVCFDDAEIGNYISDPAELAKKKQWVRDAIEKESWGYYTNLSFTGWESCSSVSTYDFRITANGAVSYGNTIQVPFKNNSNPNYERYHIQSATVHEAGHFLRFPHEHLRLDSTYYQPEDHANQKFRFRMVDATWFTIRPDVNLNLCLTISSGLDVTQEVCNNSHSQHFKFKEGGHGAWSRIENRSNLQCFDIRGGGVNVGAQLISYSCHGGDNQKFKTVAFPYQNINETVYAVQIKLSLQWLDIPNGATNTGVNPIQYPGYFSEYANLTPAYDRYSVMSYENGSLRPNSFILSDGDISGSRVVYGSSGASRIEEYIVTNGPNKCVKYNVISGLTQNSCSTSDSENKFRIIYLDEHYFRIFDPDTNKCLAASGSDLVMANCSPEGGSSNDQQRFTFIDESINGAQWTRIQSKSSNQCLDVYGGGSADEAEIGLWSCHTGYNQYFRVTRDLSEGIFDWSVPATIYGEAYQFFDLAVARLTLLSNGTAEAQYTYGDGGDHTVLDTWISAWAASPESGFGNDFQVRFTDINNDQKMNGTFGVWLSMDTARTIEMAAPGTFSYQQSVLVEFAYALSPGVPVFSAVINFIAVNQGNL